MNKYKLISLCIDEILEGKSSLEDCIGKYPEVGDELRACFAAAESLHKQTPAISAEFKSRARSRLFAADRAPLPKAHRTTGFWGWLRPSALARAPLAVILGTMGVVGSGAGIVYASQDSLPGEVLYTVKISSENIRLALTTGSESKAKLNLELAERRVEEAVAQSERGESISYTTPEKVAHHLDAAINEIDNLDEEASVALISQLSQSTINQQATLNQALVEFPEENQVALEETIDASRRGSTVAVLADANPSFLDSRPSVTDSTFEFNFFKLEGILISVGDDWNVGGVIIKNVVAPRIAQYSVDNRVIISGSIYNGKTFIFSIRQRMERGGNEVNIEGFFNGTSEDGSVWYVSGIPINKPRDASPLSESTNLKLTGTVQDGAFTATSMEIGAWTRDVTVTGTLIEVSYSESRVVIEVAGARITANIEIAEIVTTSGASLEKSVLDSLIGTEIKVSGLKSFSGLMYASKIYVTQ